MRKAALTIAMAASNARLRKQGYRRLAASGAKHLLAALMALLLTISALPIWAETTIRLGVLAVRPKAQAITQWQPLADYLQTSLGQPVELSVYGFPELESAVAQNALDVVLTNPSHFILLRHRSNLSTPLATQISREGENQLSSFGGAIFTRADDSTINSLADLAGKRIAATSTDSLGGYQMQALELLDAGVAQPVKDKLLATGMPHDRAVEAVLAGRADAGFMRSGILEAMAREGKLDLGRIKIIHPQNLPAFPYTSSTRLYPEWPVAIMPQVDEPLARRLTVALLSMPSDSTAARAAGIHGFTLPANYSPVENVLRRLRIPPFDTSPNLTLAELWQEYAIWITALLGALALIFAGMGMRLLKQKKLVQLEQQRFATVFESAPEPMWIIADGRFTDCNMAAVKIFGYTSKESLLTLSLSDFSPELQPDDEDSRIKIDRYINAAANGEPQNFEWVYLKSDGREFSAVVSLVKSTLNGVDVVLAAGNDITERKLAQQHLQHHNRVLQMLTAEATLASMLEAIALDVESIDASMLCSILLLDDEGKCLRHGAAPSLPEFFNKAIDGMAIGPDTGACGTSAFSGEQVIVEDAETHASCQAFLPIANLAGIVSSWSQPIISGQGKVLGTLSIYHRHACTPTPDDMQFLEDEARLAALAIEKTTADTRLKLAASVFSHAREGIMITDAAGTIIEVNDTFTSITGYSREEALGQNPRMLHSNRHEPAFYEAMWKYLLAKGHWYGEVWNQRKNGEIFAEMLTISAVKDSAGRVQNYVALFTDITPMKEHQQQLEHIAHYDALTSLPNRVLLADRLQHAIIHTQRREHSLAVAFLDLDGFKAVNDKYGHNIGDELLIAVSQRMKAALREGDTLARIGGDEFVAVLVDLEQPQHCEPVLHRLLQAAANPVIVGEAVLQVSASIGVTIYPQDDSDADLLMRHADQAMYVAKQAGKNRYHLFDVDNDAAVQTQRESVERIRLALDRHEFVLHYQPKVNMKTGEVVGAEALIRWQHPERGLLPPIAFLPNIENLPISVELGEWVIATALKQLTSWHAAGLDIPVSVNIAARQLQHIDFVARLSELLAVYPDVKPGCLELEILETSALEDITQVSTVMQACRKIGVRFALDDFGTGYSSLTYLKRLPADVLKIDQSFVRDMLDDPNDLAIVEGVVGLAAAFRRGVIAEGVETLSHGQLLLSLGCELAQGYVIARPMPAEELPAWAKTWRPSDSWTVWGDHPLTRDDITVIHAEVEHRHWIRNIDSYISGNLDMPPPMNTHKCHFGVWLETEGLKRYGENSIFPTVLDLHDRVHALGRKLLGLYDRGDLAEAHAQLKELYTLRDELIAKLQLLAGGPR